LAIVDNRGLDKSGIFHVENFSVNDDYLKVIHGSENVRHAILLFIHGAAKKIDSCLNSKYSSSSPDEELLDKARIAAVNEKGLKIRYIMYITQDNITYCKKLLAFSDVRHVDRVKGNFEVADEKVFAIDSTSHISTVTPKLILGNIPEVAEQQQIAFDFFWDHGVPAQERINEIVQSRRNETDSFHPKKSAIEIIRDKRYAESLFVEDINLAHSEILIAVNSIRFLIHLDQTGSLMDNIRHAHSRGVAIIILYQENKAKENREKSNKIREEQLFLKDIRTYAEIKSISGISGTILITDNSKLLTISHEEKDDKETERFGNSVIAVHSNNETITRNFGSLLEALWVEKELLRSIIAVKDELKNSNQRLIKANKQLETNEKMKEEFMNITAHELRTPLQAITGYIEMALYNKGYKEFDSNNGKYLQIIDRNSDRLQNLIEQILDVAKIEANRLTMEKVTVEINEEIENLVDEYSIKLQPHIKISVVESETKPLFVNVDKLRIYQVITNLINNALKSIEMDNLGKHAGKEGTITISVKLHSSTSFDGCVKGKLDNGRGNTITDLTSRYKMSKTTNNTPSQFVIISVKDTGKGISKEILSKLFSKFSSFSEKGTGLGLYVSKKIVEAHGGKIWAQDNMDYNSKENGATFSFSLPRWQPNG
jgi:two-component system sensor histidine kinase VicK